MPTKRTSKFWYKNEKEVLRRLGLTPTPGSGSGDIAKEDGYNGEVLLQLKSTEARSITVHKRDVDDLVVHASVEHKAPVFAVNFVEDGSVWLMVRPGDVKALLSLSEPVYDTTAIPLVQHTAWGRGTHPARLRSEAGGI